MSVPLLETRDLAVHYGAIQALHQVNLRVEPGQIVALIGANGAGKSTTLRAISGMVRPSAGDVLFEGKSIVGKRPHEIVRLGISMAPEGRGIFANLSVADNLRTGAFSRNDHAEIAKDRERMLEMFPRLRERLKQNAGTLSGGEQQMLAIARALLARPRLLLLDEPSLGLAPQLVQTIFRVIVEINHSGTSILLVEQNAHMALHIADFGYVMEVGDIVLHDRASELAASDQVQKVYLGVG